MQNTHTNMTLPNLTKATLCAAFLAAASLPTVATPLQRADIPADPAWMLHLDVDGLRPTAVGKFVMDELDKPEAQAKLSAFQTIFNFDFRTQLHGLTLYATGTNPEEGVLVVYADFDAGRLVTLAKSAQDYDSTEYKKHVIHHWMDDKGKSKDGSRPLVYAAIEGKRIIFGQKQQAVSRALDVLDGATASLASTKNLPDMGVSAGKYIVEAAARKLDVSSSDPSAAIFRLSKQVRLQIGQTGAKVGGVLTLEAADDDVAGNIVMIAQGMLALLKLQKEKPELLKIADALALKQDGPRVVVNLTLSSDDVLDLMKADSKRKAARAQKE
jgi:hypothetical protein